MLRRRRRTEVIPQPPPELADRQQTTLTGVVESVTGSAPGTTATLTVHLRTDVGPVCLVWLGRRAIRGIDQGRTLRVHGRACRRGGVIVIDNPGYEILPVPRVGAPDTHEVQP